ncbi:FtsX-like permease family protein [Ulvibacterium sp.]|uniref:ABC transporter permease n=1 Tax=Ulvibacterium sp. TaxID=2665914 RepID=UPI003BAC4538
MFKNYLKIAWRNLSRHKTNAIINISGLSVGIAVCLIIFLVIRFELSFDGYHKKKDRIYRVMTEYHHPNVSPFTNKAVPYPVPENLKEAFPQIERVAPVLAENDTQIKVLDNNGDPINGFREETGVFYTKPALFNIFDYPFIVGSAASLKDPNKVVLSREMAIKYFGTLDGILGKNLLLNNEEIVGVIGVIENVPPNTDLQLKIVISYGTGYTSNFLTTQDWDGTNGDFGTFVLLSKNASASTLAQQLRSFGDSNKSDENENVLLIQPLADIHYDTSTGNFSNRSIGTPLVNVLWLVAAFILLIACVNFINLTTAQMVNRSKEIGVRKVLGGDKGQLRKQFLSETFLIVLFSEILAFGLVCISLKKVGALFDIPLTLYSLFTPAVVLFFMAIAVLVTIFAGFYPSIVLSAYNPVTALKSKLANPSGKGISLRRGLVVFQFAIAQVLIIGALIMVRQMEYFMEQPLGFKKEALVNVPIPTDSISLGRVDFLRDKLAVENGIQNVSFNMAGPISDGNWWTNFVFDHAAERTDFFVICKALDKEYLATYGIDLVAGRNVRETHGTYEYLVNETLVKKLGFEKPEEVLNKEVNLGNGRVTGPVVGVLKDFHARSFKRGLDPVLLANNFDWYSQASIKLSLGQERETLDRIEAIWNDTFPDYIFQYDFLDAQVASYYEQERRLSNLYKLSAGLAIFLSCLGLYGLASFLVQQRRKEAGIRKVLGATKQRIVYLFSKEFVALVFLAFCIAAPVSGYFMQQWLENYPFRINLSWTIFMLGGAVTLVVALATVGYLAFKAASVNPVKSLRTE